MRRFASRGLQTADENDESKKFSGEYGACWKPCEKEIPQDRNVEQITDVHVPQIMEEFVEVAKIAKQERVQQRTVKEIVDVPVAQFLEEIVEVIETISQERISERDI